MRMTNPMLEVALPALMREQRERTRRGEHSHALEELLGLMVDAAARRGLAGVLAELECEAVAAAGPGPDERAP